MNAKNLVPQDNSDLGRKVFCRFFQGDRIIRLLHGIDGESFALQRQNGIFGILIILPFHAFFSAERRFMNLLIRRAATNAAEDDALDTHRIRSTENSAYIILASNIIQHHHQRQFVRFAILIHRDAI